MKTDRRSFIQKSLFAATAVVIAPDILQAKVMQKKINIKKNSRILFQGDSITDAGRDRKIIDPNSTQALGNGYALLTAAKLLKEYVDKDVQIYNRGISGHKVPQLQERWQTDCIDLKPDILSILIGINDYWHKRSGNYSGNAQDFKNQYENLIESTLENLPDVTLIIGEPFGVKGVRHVTDDWYPELQEYQDVARQISKQYDTLFIPYQHIFDEAIKKADGAYWTTDGVHTSLAGAELMSEAWLKFIR